MMTSFSSLQHMNVVLLLNCDPANKKAGLRQAQNVLRQLCDNGNKVTVYGEYIMREKKLFLYTVVCEQIISEAPFPMHSVA